MKKYFSMLVVAALGLFASCTQDVLVGEEGGELTTITVTAPQLGLGTRAGATAFDDPALSDMRVTLIISTEDQQVVTVTSKTHSFGTGSTPCTFEARLYKGKIYNLSAWADFGEAYYTIPTQPTTTAEVASTKPVIKMASTDITGNLNKYDAYFGNETKTLTENTTVNIVLTRPFALVKVNTTDWDENAVKLAGYRPDAYATTFKAPTQLNLVSGVADEAADINTSAAIVEYDQDGATKELHYDYLFANTTASILDAFTVSYKQGTTENSTYTFENIPVQRNYQTNITGNILTKNGKINVTINPLWNQPETPVVLFTTYDEAQNYLNSHKSETGQTVLSIDEEVKSGETKNLYIPDNTKKGKWIFDLKNLKEGGNVNVYDEHPADGGVNYKNEVEVHLPDGVTANNAYINTPNAHASMVGSFGTIDATTGDNTLVIEKGSNVGKLIVRKGGLEIHGTVNEVEVIIAGTDKVYVRDCEGLSQSVYDVLAPYIDVDGGYAGVQNGTKWDVKKGLIPVVAKIGTTDYYVLQSAFNEVADGQTIELAANLTQATGVHFNKNVAATFDLKGFTFKVTNDTQNSHRAIKTLAGTLTVKNGVVDARNVNAQGEPTSIIAGNYDGIYGAFRAENGTTLNLKDLTVYNNHFYGYSSKYSTGSTGEIDGCTFYSSYGGAVEAAGGVLTVKNSTVHQEGISTDAGYDFIASGVGVSTDGVANVKDCQMSAQFAAFTTMTSGGTINVNGGTYSANEADGYVAKLYKSYSQDHSHDNFVNLQAGTFAGNFGFVGDGYVGTSHINVSGGTYTVDPSTYVVAGYKAVANGTTPETWKVVVDPLAGKVAKIGEVGYGTLQEAFNAVKANETITLLENVTLSNSYTYDNPVAITKSGVVLDLNGNTITSSVSSAFKVKGTASSSVNNVTIKNGSLNVPGVTTARYAICAEYATGLKFKSVSMNGGANISYNSTAEFDDCTIYLDLSVAGSNYYAFYVQQGGRITILDGSYTATNNGSVINLQSGTNATIKGGTFYGNPVSPKNASQACYYLSGGSFQFQTDHYWPLNSSVAWIQIADGYSCTKTQNKVNDVMYQFRVITKNN